MHKLKHAPRKLETVRNLCITRARIAQNQNGLGPRVDLKVSAPQPTAQVVVVSENYGNRTERNCMKRLARYGLAMAAAAVVGLGVPAAAQADEIYYIGAYPTDAECQYQQDLYEDYYGGFGWCESDVWDGRTVWKLYLYT
ncbi:hypothetical protein [Glycomyces salinus]|uniref:hypothetical protein n=1 Tax=Glycomyces salinus TaxID=980294 RepID=UPI0018EA7D41|nr:hypothetical protein [Glycomyces salinus]